MTAKVPLKVRLRLRFQSPGKPRTAGLCGWAAGACDCGPLSCAFIERPSPLRKPSCKVRLFVQNRSRHNAVPNHFSSHFSTSLTNGPRSLSRAKVCTHSAFGERSHTTAHTPKQGAFWMGALSLPSERSACSRTSPGRVSERHTLPLWGIGQGCFRRTQRASEQRCAYARRCSEASRPRWAA